MADSRIPGPAGLASGTTGPADGSGVMDGTLTRRASPAPGLVASPGTTHAKKISPGGGLGANVEAARPELRAGKRGAAVAQLQKLLNAGRESLPKLVVDGIFGRRTRRAVRNFQRLASIVIDGIVGPVTWENLLRKDAPGPGSGTPDKSEREPEPESEPKPRPTPVREEDDDEDDEAEEDHKFKLVALIEVVNRGREGSVAGATPADTSGDFAKILERKDKDGDAYKQVVNLEKNLEGASKTRPDYGRYIELRARIAWEDGDKSRSLSGKKVHLSYTATPHTDPKRPAKLKKGMNEGLISADGKKTAIRATNAKGWTPVVKFYVSRFAGDKFTVHAQADVEESGKPSGAKLDAGSYVVWRKFWYQVTHAKGKVVETPSDSIAAYKAVCADMLAADTAVFKKKDMADADRTFYPDWMVASSGGTDADAVVIGGHNRSWFYKKFKKESKRPVKGHLITCDYQWDPAGETELKTHPMTAREDEITFSSLVWNAGIVKPALKGDLVVEGKWKRAKTGMFSSFFRSIKAIWSGKKGEGALGDDDIIIEKGRSDLHSIKVKLPDACPDPAKTAVVVELKLNYGKFYAGESNVHQMLIVYRTGKSKNFNQVVAHEFGHGFGQTPKGASPDGLPKHATQYATADGHGGVGSHCKTGSKSVVHKRYPKGLYKDGTCIMFHQVTPAKCTQTFCAVCDPYLRLRDMSEIKKS